MQWQPLLEQGPSITWAGPVACCGDGCDGQGWDKVGLHQTLLQPLTAALRIVSPVHPALVRQSWRAIATALALRSVAR
jgi:hypothetical protein